MAVRRRFVVAGSLGGLALLLAGCASQDVTVSPSSLAPTVVASPWNPINGYTQADYQAYLDMMNDQAQQQSMDYDEQTRFPDMVNCAWNVISSSLPHDQVMSYINSGGDTDSGGVGKSIQDAMDQCSYGVAVEESRSASPSD